MTLSPVIDIYEESAFSCHRDNTGSANLSDQCLY